MIYARDRSPYWWFHLEGTKIRKSTKIRIKAATPEQTKRNRVLAEAAYNAMMGDLAREKFNLPSTAPPPAARTFDEQAAWYEENLLPHHRGGYRERTMLAKLREVFGTMALRDIRPSRWQEYVTTRVKQDGVRLSTPGRALTLLKGVLASAVGDYIDRSPLEGVTQKVPKTAAKRTITGKEEPLFLKALLALDRELHDMYVVGVGTLLRQGNLLGLRRQDHRGDRLVVETKTGPHQVPLRGPTALQRRAGKVLAQRRPAAADGVFFPIWHRRFAQQAEDPANARVAMLRIVRAAAQAADIPWGLSNGGIVWHTATRATGATRMLREFKVDIRTVQLLGGWKSLDQMAQYLGIDQQVF